MGVADQFVDRLDASPLYGGVLAVAYDAWMPPGSVFADDAAHLETIRRGGGPALELGCGTGRFLVQAIAAGYEVEGIDHSGDMLARCRGNFTAASIDAPLHLGDIAPLALGRTYAAIVCPAAMVAPRRVHRRAGDGRLRRHQTARRPARLGGRRPPPVAGRRC